MVPDAAALIAFGDEIGWPVIAKTSRGGYDGKGVWKLDSAADADQPFAHLADGVAVIAEEFIDFRRELSALVVRSPSARRSLPGLGIRAAQRGLRGDDHPGTRARRRPDGAVQQLALGSPTSSVSSDCSPSS